MPITGKLKVPNRRELVLKTCWKVISYNRCRKRQEFGLGMDAEQEMSSWDQVRLDPSVLRDFPGNAITWKGCTTNCQQA